MLCAIYGTIGASSYKRVSAETVARLAAGLGSKKAAEAYLKNPKAPPLLTPRQVRLTWDSLRDLGFYAKFTPGRRHTFFSHRLTQAELMDALLKRATYSPTARITAAEQKAAWKAKLAALASERRDRYNRLHDL